MQSANEHLIVPGLQSISTIILVSTDFTITPLSGLSSSTSQGVFSLKHGVNCRSQELEPEPSRMLPYAKYTLHLGGVNQWLKEDRLDFPPIRIEKRPNSLNAD